jgi:hypothetical protein
MKKSMMMMTPLAIGILLFCNVSRADLVAARYSEKLLNSEIQDVSIAKDPEAKILKFRGMVQQLEDGGSRFSRYTEVEVAWKSVQSNVNKSVCKSGLQAEDIVEILPDPSGDSQSGYPSRFVKGPSNVGNIIN